MAPAAHHDECRRCRPRDPAEKEEHPNLAAERCGPAGRSRSRPEAKAGGLISRRPDGAECKASRGDTVGNRLEQRLLDRRRNHGAPVPPPPLEPARIRRKRLSVAPEEPPGLQGNELGERPFVHRRDLREHTHLPDRRIERHVHAATSAWGPIGRSKVGDGASEVLDPFILRLRRPHHGPAPGQLGIHCA